MLSLFIDGSAVELPADLSFTLTRENPMLSKSQDYSFDLQLPLRTSLRNQGIFGKLHLPGAEIPTRPFFFQLESKDELRLDGFAYIDKLTETNIGLRLVAGRSSMASLRNADGSPIYLDEIPDIKGWFAHPDEESTEPILSVGNRSHPIYNPEKEVIYYAEKSLPLSKPDAPNVRLYMKGKERSNSQPPQLHLLDVLRVILLHFGFTLSLHEKVPAWWSLVYIANARATSQPKWLLPHWTVQEFIDEVQFFFSANIEVLGKTVLLTPRTEVGMPRVALKFVADERSVTAEQPAKQSDAHPLSVNYDWQEAHPQLLLPQAVIDQARIHTVDSREEMFQKADDLEKSNAKELERAIFCIRGTKERYALLTNHGYYKRKQLHPVDYLSPYNPAAPESLSRSTARTLRIVPARRDEFHIVKPDPFNDPEAVNLDSLLNPLSAPKSEEKDEQPAAINILEVFLRNPNEKDIYTTPMELGTTHGYIDPGTGLAVVRPTTHAAESFYLGGKIPQRELSRVDTMVTLSVTIADRLPFANAGAIYNINGKDYLCRKLTIKLDTQGVAPLIEGEFHPLRP